MSRSRSSPRAHSSASVSSSDSAFPDPARATARRNCCGVAWGIPASLLRYAAMLIVALAGGVGAGKFLRGVDHAYPGALDTVVVNTGDDIVIHGLHVSPDLDSACYWLADLMDRERGWGRAGETFHAMEAMRASGRIDAWFNLGDRDLVTHVVR